MAGNSFGQAFRISTFGESHGGAVGVVVDGCPPGLALSEADIQPDLDRRKPGQSAITTPRKEEDTIAILSGVFEGKTTGTPILILAHNKDQRSADYDRLREVFRPSHADYTYLAKYGLRDWRGSGRASARETLARVAAGAIARKYLQEKHSISCLAFVQQVGTLRSAVEYHTVTREMVESNLVRCPDSTLAPKMLALIEEVRDAQDSIGGVICGIIRGLPAGLGEPVFDKLHADLGKAILSINAVKGFEIGSGFACAEMRGSQHNDALYRDADGRVRTRSNFAGGVVGGISNGEDVVFRAAFKPVATIGKAQHTLDTALEPCELKASGRHDPCVLPRAVPMVEAMALLVVLDHLMRQRAQMG